MNLSIDVISDIICPWCYIGKRRLEQAISASDGTVVVRWLPFQLNPTMPKEGVSRREYRTRKFGSWERSQELDARVFAIGKEEGIPFAFDHIERTPNTLDAHRLVGLAERDGVQDEVVEALFRSYFTQGKDIGKRETLLEVARETGLDREQAEIAINGNEGLEAFELSEELCQSYRVTGVPFFVVNGSLPLSGAQTPNAFLEAFRQQED